MNPDRIHSLPPELQVSAKLNFYYQSEEARLGRRQGVYDRIPVGPVPLGLSEQEDAFQRENFPEGWARTQLERLGVVAVRPAKNIGISGHSYSPEEVLFPWPIAPAEGFATKEQIEGILDHDKEVFSDGSARLLTGLVVAGRRYKEGTIIELWPVKPLRGFITAIAALELLTAGILEPAELSPEV